MTNLNLNIFQGVDHRVIVEQTSWVGGWVGDYVQEGRGIHDILRCFAPVPRLRFHI